ncbi:transcriptional regulator PpsR [Pseudotabrizicola alkalilacus]|uniref:Transcriptional regulator PpsR n=1 Tax=Pseudotabrizicola alkalilacus TaxID=2305252 RepID=A0A411Z1T3_9RHOB|nr:transcriptional regulator PpsR [Pseudotabrizicola alkalilacus]RGP36992.1 transcriptional regulator PpsR [Pseudotabrizicola alkalilacus]
MTTDGRHLLNGGKLPLIAPELLGEIIASAGDLALLISPSHKVVSVLVNPAQGIQARVADWEGVSLQSILAAESWRKLEARLADLGNRRTPAVIELNHADRTAWEFPVRYSLHRIGSDDSVLMIGRDLRPIAEVQQQLISAQLALERDYEAQREADTRYRVLMEVGRDPIVIVSMSTGRITDLNPAAATLLGGSRADMIGAAIAQEFEGRRRGEFLESMANLAVAESAGPIELSARRSQKRLLVTPTMFRAAGERLLMCQLDHADTVTPQGDDLTGNLARLYQDGVDGIVFTDADGIIVSANEAFLNLTDSANTASVRGRSLADYLARGAVDLRVLMDNVKRTGQLRLYATRLTTDFSGQTAVELSASWLNDRPNPVLALVVRDVSRADSLRRPAGVPNEEGMRNVMELVGSSTLRDIVAETTDVIEKMCIETALELTRNNRVAAADMLSLSRQSLYVKLRKYGLINKDSD